MTRLHWSAVIATAAFLVGSIINQAAATTLVTKTVNSPFEQESSGVGTPAAAQAQPTPVTKYDVVYQDEQVYDIDPRNLPGYESDSQDLPIYDMIPKGLQAGPGIADDSAPDPTQRCDIRYEVFFKEYEIWGKDWRIRPDGKYNETSEVSLMTLLDRECLAWDMKIEWLRKASIPGRYQWVLRFKKLAQLDIYHDDNCVPEAILMSGGRLGGYDDKAAMADPRKGICSWKQHTGNVPEMTKPVHSIMPTWADPSTYPA